MIIWEKITLNKTAFIVICCPILLFPEKEQSGARNHLIWTRPRLAYGRLGLSTLLWNISLWSGLWNIAQGGDPLKADVNHSGRCYGLEWPIELFFSLKTPSQHVYLITNFFWLILFTFLVQKPPFSKGFFHMFISGSTQPNSKSWFCYITARLGNLRSRVARSFEDPPGEIWLP